MATGTIDSELFVLYSGRFGTPRYQVKDLHDGVTGSRHHNVATAAYPIGAVAQYYNTGDAGQPGLSEFVYLKCSDLGGVAAAKKAFAPDSATIWYEYSNDPDEVNAAAGGGPAVFSISAMTTLYYGWFWCGGVCPEGAVSALGGTFQTVATVAVATAIGCSDLGGTDEQGLGVYVTLTHKLGWCLADDTDD